MSVKLGQYTQILRRGVFVPGRRKGPLKPPARSNNELLLGAYIGHMTVVFVNGKTLDSHLNNLR